MHYFWQKVGWAAFWAMFSQTHLVTLFALCFAGQRGGAERDAEDPRADLQPVEVEAVQVTATSCRTRRSRGGTARTVAPSSFFPCRWFKKSKTGKDLHFLSKCQKIPTLFTLFCPILTALPPDDT
jgi:hypothetical protein